MSSSIMPDEMPDWAPILVRAPAKLTTSLRVTGVRDDGYHLIDAEMVTLDLVDDLEIGPGDDLTVHFADLAGAGLAIETTSDNLVSKALRLVGRRAAVVVHKRIPAGAGLGGGSADAAAILRWAGVRDPLRAVELGADVAFCLGGGRARVRGIGEELLALDHHPQTFTLLTPPFGCSTVAVYKEWDRLGGPQGNNGNDLEPAALSVEPRLREWRDQLADATGLIPRLAGSGSTWFVEGAFEGPRLRVVSTYD